MTISYFLCHWATRMSSQALHLLHKFPLTCSVLAGSRQIRIGGLVLLGLSASLQAAVHYEENGYPWSERASSGPDAEVPGWYYNLGITGLRAQLVANEPKALLIKYIFAKTPASGQIEIGDVITGVGGKPFVNAHRNGYGMDVFGADGPIAEFADALESCQSAAGKGKLKVTLRRGTATKEITLDVGLNNGSYAATFPDKCPKSERITAALLQYLLGHQGADGSFGDAVQNTFVPLALLANGDARHLPAIERCVRFLATSTQATDPDVSGLVNWHYMCAGIVLSEYYLATKQAWVLPELQEVHDFIAKSQYLTMSQINPGVKKSHPESYPQGPENSHGGWGHNPGFEGYGPIAMITGQGALAYSLMHRCGITIDRTRHDAAYNFLKRGTGANGYVWYGDGLGGGPNDWADPGRTGVAGIANAMSPYPEPDYRMRALQHAKLLGDHPQSFPDTHASPIMGMGYAALAAHVDPASFRRLMDANRWWFTMAQCPDGSFYYQPNRDNTGYGEDSRTLATAVTAFIYTMPKRTLVMTGRQDKPIAPAEKR